MAPTSRRGLPAGVAGACGSPLGRIRPRRRCCFASPGVSPAAAELLAGRTPPGSGGVTPVEQYAGPAVKTSNPSLAPRGAERAVGGIRAWGENPAAGASSPRLYSHSRRLRARISKVARTFRAHQQAPASRRPADPPWAARRHGAPRRDDRKRMRISVHTKRRRHPARGSENTAARPGERERNRSSRRGWSRNMSFLRRHTSGETFRASSRPKASTGKLLTSRSPCRPSPPARSLGIGGRRRRGRGLGSGDLGEPALQPLAQLVRFVMTLRATPAGEHRARGGHSGETGETD